MIKQFHELKIGDVFISDHPDNKYLRLCKIAEPIPGMRKSEQLPNAIVVDDVTNLCSIRPAKDYFNSKLGHYMVLSYDEPVDLVKSIYDDKYAEDIYNNQVKRHNKRFVEIIKGYMKEADLESVLKNFIDLLQDEE